MAAQPNRRTPTPPPSRRPLLVTCDAYLLDELVRIAARVNVLLDVAPDVPSARLAYATAPLVLVGVDLAQACVRAGLTRRRALVLVGRHPDDGPPDWPIADELAAEHIAALPAAEPWLAKRLADAGRRAALPAEPAAEPPVRAVPRLATGSRARVGADWPTLDVSFNGEPHRMGHPGNLAAARPADEAPARPRRSGALRAGPAPGAALAERSVPEAALAPAETAPAAPAAPPRGVSRVAGVTRSRGLVIAVLGGRGGAGASVLATGLAVTAARAGVSTVLVDADPLGGGLDLVLGWEDVNGLRWPGLAGTPDAVAALPRQAGLAALSFDRTPASRVPVDTLAGTLAAARRSGDLVVVDLPRRFDDAAALALAEAEQTFLVVPAELRACAAAVQVAEAARRHCERLSVVVRGPSPGGLQADDVTKAIGLPLAGYLRPEPRLARDLESGLAPGRDGRGPIAVLCRQLLGDLGVTGQREAA